MGTVTVETRNSSSSLRRLRLLLLEHDPSDATKVLLGLKDSDLEIVPCIVKNQLEFKNAISSGKFDAVISAWTFADSDGQEALQILREHCRETPLLLGTGEPEEKAAAECAKCGATDYVSKDRMARLPFALKRAVGEHRLSEETALKASARADEAHSRELVENSVYGVFRAGLDGTFLSANDTLLRILACSSFSEVQALNLANDVFRFPADFMKLLADSREQTVVHNTETEWRRRDGGFVSVRPHIRRISNLGAAESLEGIVEDVTEVRALERQLRQAQKFETIGQLAGGLAHDFNNVLGAVLGWAEMGYEQSREHPQIANISRTSDSKQTEPRPDRGTGSVCPPPAAAAATRPDEPHCGEPDEFSGQGDWKRR